MSELTILIFNQKRVITTKDLAKQFVTKDTNIKTNFNNNRLRFVEGKDYFKLDGPELKEFKRLMTNINDPSIKYASVLTLWTERGAVRHAKILDTDKAWDIYKELEETYLKVKKGSPLKQPDSYTVDDSILRAKQWIQKHEDNINLIEKSTKLIAATITIEQISKEYGMTALRMNKLLHKYGVQYALNGNWILYAKYKGRGYTPAQSHSHKKAAVINSWTKEGKNFLYDFLKLKNIIPVAENKNIFYSRDLIVNKNKEQSYQPKPKIKK